MLQTVSVKLHVQVINMLQRKLYQYLLDWKNNQHKVALCISGARQVGKTTLVRYFAQNNYSVFVELNFALHPEQKLIFEDDLSVSSIISKLSSYCGKELVKGDTLIFLDEIQDCPNARLAIKTLVEDGKYDYIESGSLLGVKTREVPSLPVGFEDHVTMYPLDLEEYAQALGVDKSIIDRLEKHFIECTPVDNVLQRSFFKIFYSYLVVGGMPAAVNSYLEDSDIAKVVNIQKNILEQYRMDITKYAYTGKDKIHDIFDALPSELEAKNRRFVLTDINKNARLNRYENSLVWLSDAGVALPCYNVNACTFPLKLNEKRAVFKLFLSDTGLLCATCQGNVQFEILTGNVGINIGGILENVIAQQLKVNGYSLYYYDSLKRGEVDFLLEDDRQIIPLEIKSGKDYKKHNALNNVLKEKEWHLNKAYVLCPGNVETKDNVVYLPWYMIMFLKKKQLTYKRNSTNRKFKLDLSELFDYQDKLKQENSEKK